MLAATVNRTFATGDNCAVTVSPSSAPIHHGNEGTCKERCDARLEHDDAAGTLLGPGPDEDGPVETLRVSQRTIHYWIESGALERDLATGQTRYWPRPAVATNLYPCTGIIEPRRQISVFIVYASVYADDYLHHNSGLYC